MYNYTYVYIHIYIYIYIHRERDVMHIDLSDLPPGQKQQQHCGGHALPPGGGGPLA